MDIKDTVITVLGAGYVGLTTAALFSNAGLKVFVVEPNIERLDTIRSGKSFFYEEGIDELISAGIKNKTLIPTADYTLAVPQSTLIFSCVGTPDDGDGNLDLRFIFDAARNTAHLAAEGSIFIQKSTVPVGTAEEILEIFLQLNPGLSYVSNPEFLREGTAIYDTLFFDRIVVGGQEEDVLRVKNIYHQLESRRQDIAKTANISVNIDRQGEYLSTSLASAELIKVTSNAFLALKISFSNSIAKLSDAVGANITEVMNAVGADGRIGRSFLNAGRGYGGGCFPKDVQGLLNSAKKAGIDLPIMQAAQDVNESMPQYIIDKLTTYLKGGIDNHRIAVLGLSFKAGTSDARKSPGIKIANILTRKGAIVYAFDPKANNEAMPELDSRVVLCDTLDEATNSAGILMLATDWNEFRTINLKKLRDDRLRIIVDAVNMFSPIEIKNYDLDYIAVGR